MTRLAALLCIRVGHLPRRRWFYDYVMKYQFTWLTDPNDPDPRNPEVVTGVLNVPMGSPKAVKDWMRWWRWASSE